jgi:hypothetical protein
MGIQGPQGPQGNTGPQGSTGPAGPQGPQGATGATGSQGPQGNTGPQGTTGAIGPQGPQGEEGATGAAGPQGPQGPQGNNGPQGPAGPAGSANISGTTNRLIKFTGANTGGISQITDDGTNIGIGTTSPITKLEVSESNPANTSSGIIQGISNNPASSFNDISALFGQNIIDDFYGIGVTGEGGWIGVRGSVYAEGSEFYTGVEGTASGSTGTQVGVYGYAFGVDGTSYGVYGSAADYGEAGYAYAGYFEGDLAYTGSLIPASDERLKENIKTMDGALDKVLLLRPTTYDFRRDEYSLMNLAKGHQFGFIAQEVKEVFPNLVHDNVHVGYPDDKDKTNQVKTEYIGLDYVSLIPVLTAAIQEQQAQIDAQQAQIEQLLLKMDALIKK